MSEIQKDLQIQIQNMVEKYQIVWNTISGIFKDEQKEEVLADLNREMEIKGFFLKCGNSNKMCHVIDMLVGNSSIELKIKGNINPQGTSTLKADDFVLLFKTRDGKSRKETPVVKSYKLINFLEREPSLQEKTIANFAKIADLLIEKTNLYKNESHEKSKNVIEDAIDSLTI